MKNSKEYFDAECKAREESIGYPFKSEFESGFDFATSQPKHIFDGAAKAGEVRRFKDRLVDILACITVTMCDVCESIKCGTHNGKYIKR